MRTFLCLSFLAFRSSFCWLVHPRLALHPYLQSVFSLIPFSSSSWGFLSCPCTLSSCSFNSRRTESNFFDSKKKILMSSHVLPMVSLWLQFPFWFWSNVISSWLTFGSIAFTTSQESLLLVQEWHTETNGVNEWILLSITYSRETRSNTNPYFLLLLHLSLLVFTLCSLKLFWDIRGWQNKWLFYRIMKAWDQIHENPGWEGKGSFRLERE